MIFGSFLIECGNELPQSGALHVLIDLALSLQLVNPSNVFYGNHENMRLNWYLVFGECLPVEFPHLQPELVEDGQVGRGRVGAPVLKSGDLVKLPLL